MRTKIDKMKKIGKDHKENALLVTTSVSKADSCKNNFFG